MRTMLSVSIVAALVSGCADVGLEEYADVQDVEVMGVVLDIEPADMIRFDPRSPEAGPGYQDVVLRSVGDQAVPIVDIYLDAMSSSVFEIADDLPLPHMLPPGNEFTVEVSFMPHAVAEFSGTLVVEYDDEGTASEEWRDLIGKGCPADAEGCQ